METDCNHCIGTIHFYFLYWFTRARAAIHTTSHEGNRHTQSARRRSIKNYIPDIKRLYHSHFDRVCHCSAGWILFYGKMVATLCLSYRRCLVDVCIGRDIGGFHCVDHNQPAGDKSRDGEPGEEFEDGVKMIVVSNEWCYSEIYSDKRNFL